LTYRLKLLAEVELPESLQEKHSMFFCVGPHAMFSNLGNGIGRITYANITNFGTTTESKMPDDFQKWLDHGLSKEESSEYGQKIIQGVAEYIPEMSKAKIIRVIPGIVKSKGNVELNNKDSDFHKRSYSGVEEQQIGWIDNAAMKLFYCLGNAEEVASIVSKQLVLRSNVDEASKKLALVASEKLFPNDESQRKIPERILQSFFINHIKRNISTNKLAARKQKKSPELSSSDPKTGRELSSSPKKELPIRELEILDLMKKAVATKSEWTKELAGESKKSSTSAKKTFSDGQSKGNSGL
jgi:hypothetical protein